jgi:hypothetical protein
MKSKKTNSKALAIALFLGLTTSLAGCEIGNPDDGGEGGEGGEGGADTEQVTPETEQEKTDTDTEQTTPEAQQEESNTEGEGEK